MQPGLQIPSQSFPLFLTYNSINYIQEMDYFSMAKKMSRQNLEAFHLWGFVCVLVLIQKCSAFEFKVGGSWTVPTASNAATYNQWAEKNRFQIGDTLLFAYDANHDSVLHVAKDDYTNCNTGAPLEKFTDGHTVFKLNQSGPFYFISGVADNCHKNEKVVVVVMADRSRHNSNETMPSPAPSPSPEVPSPSPSPSPASASNETLPSPAPTVNESPPSPAPAAGASPPSPSGVDTNPTPSPSLESSPPNSDASSTVINGAGIIAAWSLVLAI